MARIWGYWDCNFCGNKGMRADVEHCSSCGSPRSKDTIFYVDKKRREEVKKEEINHNVNWICAYCDSQNDAIDTTCVNCGASKNESTTDYLTRKKEIMTAMKKKEIAERITKRRENADEIEKESDFKAEPKREITREKTSFSRIFNKYKRFIIPVLIACLVAGILAWVFSPSTDTETIQGFSWTRVINIEELKTFNESGWSLPSGARLTHSAEEIRTYKQEIDYYETKTRQVPQQSLVGYEPYVSGYKDVGNGQFEEIISQRPVYETYYDTETYQEPVYKDVPVYDTKYYYEIDRWIETRSVRTSGENHEPYWGEVALVDNEREGNRNEYYYVICDKHTGSVPYSAWSTYKIGDEMIVTTDRFGNIVYSMEKK